MLKEEKLIYSTIGSQAIAANLSAESMAHYFEIVKFHHVEFSQTEGHLQLSENRDQERAERAYRALLKILDEKIATYQHAIDLEKEKRHTSDKEQRLQAFISEQLPFINLRTKLVAQIADAAALRHKQKTVHAQLKPGTHENAPY